MSNRARAMAEKLVFEPFQKSEFSENKHASEERRPPAGFYFGKWPSKMLKVCLLLNITYVD